MQNDQIIFDSTSHTKWSLGIQLVSFFLIHWIIQLRVDRNRCVSYLSNLQAKLERSLGLYCHMLSNCTWEYKTHALLLPQSILCWAQALTEPTLSPPSLNTNLGCLSSARAYACIKPCVELELSLPDLFKLGFSLTCRSVTRKVLLYHLIIDRRNNLHCLFCWDQAII